MARIRRRCSLMKGEIVKVGSVTISVAKPSRLRTHLR